MTVASGQRRAPADSNLTAHHRSSGLTVPVPAPATDAGRQWVEDLSWHRRQRRQARMQWAGEDVLDVITRRTGGQLDFTTVDDLALLHETAQALTKTTIPIHQALADRLARVEVALTGEHVRALTGPWPHSCAVLGIEDTESARLRATAAAHLHPSAGPPSATGPDQAAGEAAVAHALGLPDTWRSPLLEAWELKQVLRMYDAASAMIEDTTCDLASELLTGDVSDSRGAHLGVVTDTVKIHPHPLPRSAHTEDVLAVLQVAEPGALARRLHRQLTSRGLPGDPRRVPRQIF